MLTVLETILPLVSKCAAISFELYRVATEFEDAAGDLIHVASCVNQYGSILKQVGTIIKEDDRLPSNEAIDTLEDVIFQSHTVLQDVESTISIRNDGRFDAHSRQIKNAGTTLQRLSYLVAHLEALRATLAVLLQTLFTAQSIMWSKLRPSISPQQATTAVANERIQLEALVIEQQMTILKCSVIFEQTVQQHPLFLMQESHPLSLVTTKREDRPIPSGLHRYQNKQVINLETTAVPDSKHVREVCNIAPSQSERLIDEWTSLPDFDSRLQDAERKAQKQKQETQQPTVESDSEDDDSHGRKLAGTVQPLIIETTSLPIQISENKFGPAAPLSPAASPRNSRSRFPTSTNAHYSPTSPLPVEAAAAIEAKEEDDEVDLEIPWTLCTRRYYWKHIDNKVVGSNTEHKPSITSLERHTWTEITASWVCKEAIQEAGHKFTQVQKDKEDGRRTRFETCFCVEGPLHFDQVKHLVERTVEIYRTTTIPPTSKRLARPSNLQLPPTPLPTTASGLKARGYDRDRTPMPRTTHPPLERSTSSLPFPASYPPHLDRSLSMPGPGSPVTQQQHQARPPCNPNLQPLTPSLGYPPQLSRTTSYTPQPHSYSSKPPSQNVPLVPPQRNHPFLQTQANGANAQPPVRKPNLDPRSASKCYDTTTSDSESGERDRSRRHRSKSRSRYSSEKEKKKRRYGATTAMGAIMGVGGLTALLDGLSGL